MKERLIGAAVLAALGVWLIPLLLDGPDEPIADRGAGLELPVPSGHVGEVRTEVIDLSPRREAGGATSNGANRAADTVSARSAETDAAPARATAAAAASTTGDRTSAAASDDAAEAPSGADRASAPVTQARTNSEAAPAASSPVSPQPAASTPARDAPAAASSARTQTNESGDWAVQVGSFSDEENARRHAGRVSTFGHSPKISTYRAGGRVMYRVRVGPHATREAAEAVASALTAHGFVAQVVTK